MQNVFMEKPTVGGQAVIEGVLMMNKDKLAIAVRKPNNKISIKKETLNSFVRRNKIFKLPLIRGVFMLIDTMVIGIKALTWSANESADEETESSKRNKAGEIQSKKQIENQNKSEKNKNTTLKSEKLGNLEIALTIALSIGGAVALFILLPLWLAKFVTADHGVWFNIIDGIFRIGIFFAYVWGISLMSDVRRVFQYHGAEHKTVNCFESGDKLNVKNVLKHSRFHPRCGTTFIFIVLIISIIAFSFFVFKEWYFKLGIRLVLIPAIAAVSYEILRLGGRYYKNPIVKMLVFPGLSTQWFTTREPDAKQVEVAIESLKSVI